jgi:hypothetical protein
VAAAVQGPGGIEQLSGGSHDRYHATA